MKDRASKSLEELKQGLSGSNTACFSGGELVITQGGYATLLAQGIASEVGGYIPGRTGGYSEPTVGIRFHRRLSESEKETILEIAKRICDHENENEKIAWGAGD